MKKFFLITAVVAFAFIACEQPTDDSTKLPSLTIRNQSSFTLTNIKFAGITFAVSGNDLNSGQSSTKQITADDIGKSGYITFTRKDIGIDCRTEAITITEDYTFNFIDQTIVEELGNSSNRKALSQIDHLPGLALEHDGRSVSRSDTVNLGESVVSYTKETVFTIKNTERGKLILDGSNPVRLEGDTDVFSILQPASSEIIQNGSLTFKINFRPTEIRPYNATVTINSNTNAYSFAITASGVPSKPIASVFYENRELDDLDTVDAGTVLLTLSKAMSVEIRNTGTEVLTIDTANITIGGTDSAAFKVSVLPNASIQVGRSSTLVLQYTPLSEGTSNAILSIPTNDDYRNHINLYLRGEAVRGTGVLELSQNDTIIGNNAINPFDFGRIEILTGKNLTFTIKNTGNIALELTGDPAVISSNPIFTILSQPANKTLSPGATVNFVIQYEPNSEQVDEGSITIHHNGNAAVFTFNIKGTGYVKRPQITVRQGNTTINNNGEFDFGQVTLGSPKDVVFTIANSGEANLVFEAVNDNTINLENNSENHFAVASQPSLITSVVPGGTTTFTVRFNPLSSSGNSFTAVIKIKSNSQNNDEFLFAVKGSSVLAALSAPTNVTATALSTNSIQITWDAVPEAINYKVYRATSATGTRTLQSTVTTTSYTNAGLDARTYWYFVTATNADNIEGTLSASASMIPKPSVPSNVRAVGNSGWVSVYVSWSTVAGAESYRVYYSTSLTGTKTLAGTSTVTGYGHDGVANTTYYYWVTAFNAAGESEYSLYTSATTPPAAPTNLRQTSATTTTITIAWDPVVGATQYYVYGNTEITLTGTALNITNCSPNSGYYFYVRAINSSGDWGPSASIYAKTN